MKDDNNVTRGRGVTLGALGVLIFSFSLPATRFAVDGLAPSVVAFGRAAVAGGIATAILVGMRAKRPSAAQARSLVIVALGVVIGFPLLSTLALETTSVGHAAVINCALPAMTAICAVMRAGERPSPWFWAAALTGLATVVAFALIHGGGVGVDAGDAEMLAAVVVCGLGYAEGAVLSRTLGGARTICWALVVALPLTAPLAVIQTAFSDLSAVGLTAWLGLGYVVVFSQILGFFAWYAGLARGGVAKIGQIQLGQPVLTLGWSALLLGEQIGPADIAVAVLVLACVAVTQTERRRSPRPGAAVMSSRNARLRRAYRVVWVNRRSRLRRGREAG
ncbi:MAG TPA: DMT family transporter [Solirubrobacteraceae bacterium]|nr:DMT family transporter [Solirubrobacteraceae bacterium]